MTKLMWNCSLLGSAFIENEFFTVSNRHAHQIIDALYQCFSQHTVTLGSLHSGNRVKHI